MTEIVHDLLDRWRDLGAALPSWAYEMVVTTFLLFVVAALLDRLLSRRLSAGARVWLYVPVWLRIVVPQGWVSPVGLVELSDSPLQQAWSVGAPASDVGRAVGVLVGTPAQDVLSVASSSNGMWVVAACPALILMAYWFNSHRTLRSQLRSSVPAAATSVGLPAGMKVRWHDSLGPIVVGHLRPIIVMPRQLAETLRPEQLKLVLQHEAAHVLRRDPLFLAVLQFLTMACWFLPGAWLALRRVKALVEQACDEHVLVDGDHEKRKAYAQTIVRVAELGPRAVAIGAVSFGSHGGLSARLRALRGSRTWSRSVQGLACGTLLACLVALAGRQAAPSVQAARVPAASPLFGGPFLRTTEIQTAVLANGLHALECRPTHAPVGELAALAEHPFFVDGITEHGATEDSVRFEGEPAIIRALERMIRLRDQAPVVMRVKLFWSRQPVVVLPQESLRPDLDWPSSVDLEHYPSQLSVSTSATADSVADFLEGASRHLTLMDDAAISARHQSEDVVTMTLGPLQRDANQGVSGFVVRHVASLAPGFGVTGLTTRVEEISGGHGDASTFGFSSGGDGQMLQYHLEDVPGWWLLTIAPDDQS